MTETNKSVLPHTLINLICRLYFCLMDEKKERTILGLHNLFRRTEKILLSTSWSCALTNLGFHFWSWMGRNFAFLQQFSSFYFCFSIVFLSFSYNNRANNIFSVKVVFRYRVSLQGTCTCTDKFCTFSTSFLIVILWVTSLYQSNDSIPWFLRN